MKTWFNRLNIQNRLFLVFGIVIVICTLAVGFNLLNTVQIGAQSEVLDRLFRTVREYYQAQDLLQKMDLAEKSFIAQGYDSYVDDFDNYSAQMETFIRQALIKASSPAEKNTLVALQEGLRRHVANFQAIIPAVYEEDWDSVNAQQEVLFEEIYSLNGKINTMLEESYTTFDDTDTLQTLAQMGAFLVSSVALIFFVILALVAAIVLNSQVNRPVQQLTEAVAAIEARQFDPATLQKLTGRQEEIGQLSRALVDMAAAIRQREQTLQQQADEIRAKIRQREENRLASG
jgi:methyl-accepting chemotaxis protein